MTSEPATYPGYRFPAEIISLAVWLYHVFGLSLRDVELILAERGIVVRAQGRPVGVALDRQDALLVADDVGNRIWRVLPAVRQAAAR
jgi:glucose/arabinose dehydrogenase